MPGSAPVAALAPSPAWAAEAPEAAERPSEVTDKPQIDRDIAALRSSLKLLRQQGLRSGQAVGQVEAK
eukprot:5867453-Lingulodinium_polyedra.AAC.1